MIVEMIFEVLCYWVGWTFIKIVTFGNYPKEKEIKNLDSLISIVGVVVIILILAIIIYVIKQAS